MHLRLPYKIIEILNTRPWNKANTNNVPHTKG